MFRKLTETLMASPQISLADVDEAAAQGVKMIINNRPEGEEPGQLEGAAIEAAAKQHGIAYRAIPVGHGGFSEPQIAAMAEALGAGDGPVLAYCRSGTRSTFLWALAGASQGGNADDLAEKAASAGYDITPIRPAMDMLSAKAK
ncbi:TIGR01244 family sulfur transferase [Altererythrobacter sp. ZODW24]|uniref:TIGR01244 family sulfur transferase n=1 Tax=Altererythrobacter sp. ZODW24 TaxID=2185142 RepID=UPI000DF76B50|nr:TIGR01244 family sulfur transferase [Altererythrobacter sp. ZODW24]